MLGPPYIKKTGAAQQGPHRSLRDRDSLSLIRQIPSPCLSASASARRLLPPPPPPPSPAIEGLISPPLPRIGALPHAAAMFGSTNRKHLLLRRFVGSITLGWMDSMAFALLLCFQALYSRTQHVYRADDLIAYPGCSYACARTLGFRIVGYLPAA